MSRISADIEKLAVRSLQNQLDLAVNLLEAAKESRATGLPEGNVIESAREAYRHSVDALTRLPQLSQKDMTRVEGTLEQFRSILSQLVPARGTCA
jgi:hypothetical protein